MRRAKQKMRCRYNLPPLTDTTYKGNRKEGKRMKATGIVRRIDELERANASLLDKLNKAIPSPTVDN